MDTYSVFIAGFAVAAFAGVAALLRSGNTLSKLTLLTQASNSGLLGLGISLIWYNKFIDNVPLLIGICLLAGLGGMSTVEFALAAFRRGGFSVKFGDNGIQMGNSDKKEDIK